MAHNVFDHLNYRDYLRKEFSGTGEGRGRRAPLARFLRCQTSFLSQVLTDRAHLSLEHALKTSEFIRHSEEEREYFMLLVQKDKGGSRALELFFEKQLLEKRKKREEIRERIQIKTELSAEDQMKYYSAWYYSAVHVLTALPGLNSIEQMSNRLRLEIKTVKEALGFLESKGFVERKGDHYEMGSRRLHLAKGSPMLPRHHSNWRMKAIEAADRDYAEDLHYSAILGISKKDGRLFKERILALLEEFEPVVRNSKEEVPVVLAMDLFELC